MSKTGELSAIDSEYSLEDLLTLMERLRDPEDGCPWDKAQDFSTLVSYTIEECYELVDAIEHSNFQHTREELGDVLFQVIFYAQLGREQERFTFSDIVSSLVEKLLRRHPHVFPDGTLGSRVGQQTADSAQIHKKWDEIKASERREKDLSRILDDIPSALPALTRALKLQKRVSKVGFDWAKLSDVFTHFQSEMAELIEARDTLTEKEIEDELGDVLFCCVNLARHLNIDPESALRKSNTKFEGRFKYVEEQLLKEGHVPEDASLELMDKLWDEAKSKGL